MHMHFCCVLVTFLWCIDSTLSTHLCASSSMVFGGALASSSMCIPKKHHLVMILFLVEVTCDLSVVELTKRTMLLHGSLTRELRWCSACILQSGHLWGVHYSCSSPLRPSPVCLYPLNDASQMIPLCFWVLFPRQCSSTVSVVQHLEAHYSLMDLALLWRPSAMRQYPFVCRSPGTTKYSYVYFSSISVEAM